MIPPADVNGPPGPVRNPLDPRITRLLHRVLQVRNRDWRFFDDDGRCNAARGILITETTGMSARLALAEVGLVFRLSIAVRLGRLRPDATGDKVLRVQRPNSTARLLCDRESGAVYAQTAAFLPADCDPQPVMQALLNDAKVLCDDELIQAIVQR